MSMPVVPPDGNGAVSCEFAPETAAGVVTDVEEELESRSNATNSTPVTSAATSAATTVASSSDRDEVPAGAGAGAAFGPVPAAAVDTAGVAATVVVAALDHHGVGGGGGAVGARRGNWRGLFPRGHGYRLVHGRPARRGLGRRGVLRRRGVLSGAAHSGLGRHRVVIHHKFSGSGGLPG